jgi:hypothetical protein
MGTDDTISTSPTPAEQDNNGRASALATAEHVAQLHALWLWLNDGGEADDDDAPQVDDPEGLDTQEDVEERARELALSCLVSSTEQVEPNQWPPDPDRFEVLTSTGGPAVRLVGELRDGVPHSCEWEGQDWFTPWVSVHDQTTGEQDDACEWFAELFCWELDS